MNKLNHNSDQITDGPLRQTAELAINRLLAAIDIGSNSIRMEIGQVLENGKIDVIDRIQRTIRLGQDTFRNGRLNRQTMQATLKILRDCKERLNFYGVKNVRVVATSALREAANAEVFIDRVLIALGLEIQIIDISEESRLTVSAVRADMEKTPDVAAGTTLISEVGGGSTILTITDNSEIVASQSLGFGAIRFQEVFAASDNWAEASDVITNQLTTLISTIQTVMPMKKVQHCVAVGATARFVAKYAKKPIDKGLICLTAKRFRRIVNEFKDSTLEELAGMFELPLATAEGLRPALLIYQAILDATGAKKIHFSNMSMRDGLMKELSMGVTGLNDEHLTEEILHSATALAKKYHVDIDHAMQMKALVSRLFKALQPLHGLGYNHLTCLQTAALLYQTGMFISSRAYHKHSFYLIANSEIFGLTKKDMTMVAHIARYHRRSVPKATHLEYMAISREDRIAVNKLAAILRIADALDIQSMTQIKNMSCQIERDEMILHLPGIPDLAMKQRALALEQDMFENIYCMAIHLEQK